MKLITVNLQCCNINSIPILGNKPFQIWQLFAAGWIMHTNIYVNHM
jgi:hypothetical protein